MDYKIATIKHSSMVAKAAYIIASETNGAIDPNKAHMAGTFHDIGKLYIRSQSEKYMHPLIGYELMMENNNAEMAAICISHPFPVFDAIKYINDYCNNNITIANKIAKILKTIKITPLIKLIQFADKISGLDSYMTFEDKFKWYIEKYNVTPESLTINYAAFNRIKIELDTAVNRDIYKLLDLKVNY